MRENKGGKGAEVTGGAILGRVIQLTSCQVSSGLVHHIFFFSLFLETQLQYSERSGHPTYCLPSHVTMEIY